MTGPALRGLGHVFAILLGALGWLPLRLGGFGGAVLGTLTYYGRGRWRRRTLENLAAALPEHDAAEHRRIARGSFRSVGRVVTELLHVCRLPAARRLELIINGDELRAVLEADRREGRGVVLLTGHLGNWGVLGAVVATLGELTIVANRPYDDWLGALIERMRRRMGARLSHNDASTPDLSGVLTLLRALRRGGFVAILNDHDIRRAAGLFVPFFGRDAWTGTFATELARGSGAVLRPLFCVREGRRFRVVIRDPIDADDVRAATLAWTRVLEQEVRARPEQWMWMHRRWRTRPPAERASSTSDS